MRRLRVPAVLGVVLAGSAACPPIDCVRDEGCGDNDGPCEVYCHRNSRSDAAVITGGGECPLCANDKGECPVGCEASRPFG